MLKEALLVLAERDGCPSSGAELPALWNATTLGAITIVMKTNSRCASWSMNEIGAQIVIFVDASRLCR